MLERFLKEEKGESLTEYITIVAGIIMVAVVAVAIYNGWLLQKLRQ